MTSLSDAQLLTRFHAGDEYALEALFERYESTIFHFLLGILRDHHTAEDVLQNTFIQALQNTGKIREGGFRSWLFAVAYQQAMEAKRRQKRLPRFAENSGQDVSESGPSPIEEAERHEEAGKIRELLDQLPAVQRQVIHARIYEGKRFREIADAMGAPLNTTLARMHDGLRNLRILWEQRHA